VVLMDRVACKKCILDSQVPGITINPETGLCQYCELFLPCSKDTKEEYHARMDLLLKSPPPGGKYHVVFALSGGVDSSYCLYRLKKEYPHLNILAVQFDNGFISDSALKNAQEFCAITKSTYLRLTVDQNALRDAFSKAAHSNNAYRGFAKYRASDICNTCINIVKQKIIELALSTKTPLVIFAFSPGQTDAPFIPLSRPFLVWMRNLFDTNLKALGVVDRSKFLIDLRYLPPGSDDPGIIIIHPFLVWDYDKPKFKQECLNLGWIDPEINDPNSSNCLLNAFAIKNHYDKYRIHSYAFDMAALVRQGLMNREEALNKLTVHVSDGAIKDVRRKLNLQGADDL